MTPIFIRASTLSIWSDCERRAFARLNRREVTEAGHILRDPARGIGAIEGTVVHGAIEFMLLHKAVTGKLPPETEPQDIARTKLREQVENGGEVQYDGPRGVTHRLGDAIDQVVRMVLTYQLHTAAKIKAIVTVEKRLEAEQEDGAIILSGQADLVCREPGSIRDVKTGIVAPPSFKPQLGGYSLLSRSHGLDIERASIDFIPRVRRNTPQPPPVTYTTNVRDAEVAAASIIKRIASATETFRLGDKKRDIIAGDPWAFLANPSSNLCSPKFCPAWGTSFCREGRPVRE